MKAVFRNQYGSHDIIQIGEMPLPIIKSDEALVKVSVTTVNRTDQGVVTGLPRVFRFFTGLAKPKHSILGTDCAGEIVKVGANYADYKIGDKVWGFCDTGWPTQAEFTVINKNISTALIPSYITDKQAVASAEAFHYAINFLNKVNLKPGKKAFVFGATGAIGSAMIQILKYNGLYVVASCKAVHFDKIKPFGADKLFDYETEKLSEITEKFDYFFDAVGKCDFKTSKLILKPIGIYISTELGPGNENLYLPLLTMRSKQKVIFPFPANIANSMLLALKMISENAFSPLIDREYCIEDAQKAYQYMMTGQKIGNVILRIS
jgi:NADPH:quinone reductase-like Zn-dependent oxidoreductase